jgi:hypothetical protein
MQDAEGLIMTLYEKIIEYGNAREELAEVRAEIELAGNQSWTRNSKKKALDDLENYWTEKVALLLSAIELELDRLSVNER